MANNTIATRWLLSKKDLFNVSFVELKDTLNLLPNLIDIEIRIKTDEGKTYSGRGTDAIGDIALEKASSEAIERWCCHDLKISTVGCAIHSIKEEAEINSRNEFIERYYFEKFMAGYLSSTYLHSSSINSETQMGFYQIAKIPLGIIILCLVFDNSQPIALGLSCKKDFQSAIKKSSIEALRNFGFYKINKDEFYRYVKADKNLWSCEPDFLNKLYSRIITSTASNNTLEIPKNYTKTIKASSILNVSDCPLYFSRTTLEGES